MTPSVLVTSDTAMAKEEPLIAQPDPEQDPDIKPLTNVVFIGETIVDTLTLGLGLLNGLFTVRPREVRLILHNGRLSRIASEPGLYWMPSFGREDRVATTADTTRTPARECWNL